MHWDETWLSLSQEELYECSDGLLEQVSEDSSASSLAFHRESLPYLVATEYPWSCLPVEPWEARTAVCVGGSGDLPLFLRSVGIDSLVAIDISRPACYLNELKQAAMMQIPWDRFLVFFLADLPRADRFLREKALSESLSSTERASLYDGLRRFMSPSARSFWDRRFWESAGSVSPFRGFLRASELFFLDKIPYLNCTEVYETWQRAAVPYPLLNLPVEVALGSTRMQFDLIYLSNVLEYARTHFMMESTEADYESYLIRFLERAVRVLTPGGMICLYLFHGRREAFEAPADAHLLKLGLQAVPCHIEYSSALLPRSRFRNTLLILRRM